MGQQAKETGKVTKRVRNIFINHPKCVAVRHDHTIYRLMNVEDREGAWDTTNFRSVNQAKKESTDIQCEAAGMKADENGNYHQRYYALGKGAVVVLR